MTDRKYLLLERLQRIDEALRLAESVGRTDPRKIGLLRLRRAWAQRQLAREARLARRSMSAAILTA